MGPAVQPSVLPSGSSGKLEPERRRTVGGETGRAIVIGGTWILVIKNAWATDRQQKICERWRQDAPAEVSVASDTPEAVSLTDGDERLRRQRRSRRLSSCAAPAPRRRGSRRASPAPSPALREERGHRQRQVCLSGKRLAPAAATASGPLSALRRTAARGESTQCPTKKRSAERSASKAAGITSGTFSSLGRPPSFVGAVLVPVATFSGFVVLTSASLVATKTE